MYNNINGQSRNMWDEMYAKNSGADILCLTERDWKQGNKGKALKGFKRYWKRHPAEGKKAGVTSFIKENQLRMNQA